MQIQLQLQVLLHIPALLINIFVTIPLMSATMTNTTQLRNDTAQSANSGDGAGPDKQSYEILFIIMGIIAGILLIITIVGLIIMKTNIVQQIGILCCPNNAITRNQQRTSSNNANAANLEQTKEAEAYLSATIDDQMRYEMTQIIRTGSKPDDIQANNAKPNIH